MKNAVAIIVPNWNGKESLGACLDSLLNQTEKTTIIVVENGSTDGSLEFLQTHYPQVVLVINEKNLGFAGGVNSGIRKAVELGAEYAALFNNDAVAAPSWLHELIRTISHNNKVGVTTGKLLSADGKQIDSTGEEYSTWGLPYPRGRTERDTGKYDEQTEIFAASGGASLYRIKMLDEIGLFDEDFFAYYEDVDICFRAQLAGWKIIYVPTAYAYHATGTTSSKIKGFTTYQTIKNLPLLLWKNVPLSMFAKIWIRLVLAWSMFVLRALSRGHVWPVIKGCVVGLVLWPKKLSERRHIQKMRRVNDDYIWSILAHDLPPNANSLRQLRAMWWKLTGH